MLEKVKLALRVTTDAFDEEICDLIDAACADMGIVGVTVQSTTVDPLLIRAITTYCKAHFGEPDEYDHLKASYDEQKAQLISCTGYGLE
jgi:hypothetical protein